MAVLATHRDRVAAPGHVLGNGQPWVEARVHLVEARDLQPSPLGDLSVSRLELREEQLHEGRLARAVGSHDAETVPPPHLEVEAAHEVRPVGRVPERQPLGPQDERARALRLVEGPLGPPLHLAPRRPLAAQLLEPPDAPHVARPARLDALADPDLLLGEELVELRVLLLLRGEQLRLPHQVLVVRAGVRTQLAAVEVDDARREALEEGSVVGDEEHGPTELQQQLLELGDGPELQVVGGLVQQEQVRVPDQGRGEERAPLHACGELAEWRLERKVEPSRLAVEPRLVLPFVEPEIGQGLSQELPHGRGPLGDLLLEAGHHAARTQLQLALVQLERARQDAHQGRLARAVAAEQAHALARLEDQVGLVEEGARPQGEGGLLELELRHRRGRIAPPGARPGATRPRSLPVRRTARRRRAARRGGGGATGWRTAARPATW